MEITKYEVLEALGEGVFGTVTKCRNRATNQIVVLKVMKKDEKMCLNFKRELEMLEHISPVFNLVKFIEFFDFQDRQSMVFEMLDISVYDLMQEEFPFSLSQARPVAKQLLIALQGLQDIAVIHADIKPDNIMLVNHREQPFKVKLIDFGVAKRSDQVYPGQMMQPISVRAPEVRLGLPLWEAVDMWSLACCLLFFCYETAEEFFGYSDFDNMTKLANFIGTPAKELLDENPDMSEEQHSIYNLEELIKRSREFVSEQESNDRDAFHDLLSKMLEINAEKRITPAQALLHPFITMDHLPKGDNYTKEAHELMRVAETMYGPLQRENLEKIAEKQKEEAIAANDFTDTHTYIHTYMYTYIYTHTHTHTPLYTHINTHTHIHTLTYTHTYTHTYIHTPIHKHIYIHTHTYTHTYTHTQTYTLIHPHTYTHTYTQTYTHTHIYTYIFIHTHIHTQTEVQMCRCSL
uniref:Protein kinase domain-containing protein n=1 Tax=Periophthalmus magnuspinnatus TaxID=409849 RepID=A0A3B3ZNB0_9GOBI